MFEDDFLETMVDEIIWQKKVGYDSDGRPTFGAPTTLQCRISPKVRHILDVHGTDVVSHATIYPAYSPAIGVEDKITLPSGVTPLILRVERPPDRDGAHHTEVMV